MTPFAKTALSALMLLLAAASQAQSVVYSGRLDDPGNAALVGSDLGAPSFVDGRAVANNVALYIFDVLSPGLVTIQSSGFAAGGIDPYFSLFAGAGSTASFVDSNYAQAFSTGGDFVFSAMLPAGTYRMALGAFANMSRAENLGTGSLADGFTGLGAPMYLGDGSYHLTLNSPVPEPAAWGLLAVALPLLLRRRR
ncbi:MAG: DVUA0089 family protein [Rubrivivax sp.]|nr:DVUA0089 family protein [Rubrivivax sp.]